MKVAQWAWEDAEQEFKRAIQLNPNCSTAHQWYSILLRCLGRFEEAMDQARLAQEIDPLSITVNGTMGLVFYVARQYEQALEQLKKTVEIDFNHGMTRYFLGLVFEATGRYAKAVSELGRAYALVGKDTEILSCLGRLHALCGRRKAALETINVLMRKAKRADVDPYFIALIYEGLDLRDEAFQWLEKGFTQRYESLALLKVDPRLDDLRSDPRFLGMLERVGLSNATNRQTLEAASGGRPR